MTGYNFRPLILDAINLFGGRIDWMFNSAAFGAAIKREFDLPHVPDGRWVERVLLGLDYVTQLPGGCHWRCEPFLPTTAEEVRRAEQWLAEHPIELTKALMNPLKIIGL